jgi:hypothetical protein
VNHSATNACVWRSVHSEHLCAGALSVADARRIQQGRGTPRTRAVLATVVWPIARVLASPLHHKTFCRLPYVGESTLMAPDLATPVVGGQGYAQAADTFSSRARFMPVIHRLFNRRTTEKSLGQSSRQWNRRSCQPNLNDANLAPANQNINDADTFEIQTDGNPGIARVRDCSGMLLAAVSCLLCLRSSIITYVCRKHRGGGANGSCLNVECTAARYFTRRKSQGGWTTVQY